MANGAVLVTGGNSGIGFECARALALGGREVLIASRDRNASEVAATKISQESGAQRVTAMALDLGSLSSVRAFVKEIEEKDIAISALVCNAGVQVVTGPNLTVDGFESTFGINHLGHFLLVNLLLPRLQKSAPARVIVVSSGVHDPNLFSGMPKPAITDLQTLAKTGCGELKGKFNGQLAYANSKLCNLWFTYELARRVDAGKITVNAFDPGLVPGSGLGREYSPALRFVWEKILPQVAKVATYAIPNVNPAPKSGAALAKLVLSPELENTTGKYFPSHTRWKEAPSSEESYSLERAKALWEDSTKLTHLSS
jgi:light-dependent protochlorophyllide reductase